MKALYRKYRPISLDTVVGQDQVVTPLRQALKRDKISHAYLFCGPRGTGKTSIARIFAHEINQFPYQLEDDFVDIVEIDAASNTGVDNIRDLREKAIIAPSEGKYKIYIIDEVHMLSKSAFNALLKLMEEPPAHVVFIMATTNPEKVPVTITSRAQVFTFRLADAATMHAHLKDIAKKEKIKIADDALEVIVQRGGGSFRDSISLLDQISNLSSSEITAAAVDAALGLPESAKITKLLDHYNVGKLSDATDTLRELLDSGTSAEALAGSLIDAITSRPTPVTLDLASRLFDVAYPFAEAKLLVAFLSSGLSAPITPKPAKTVSASGKSVALENVAASDAVSSEETVSQAAAETEVPRTREDGLRGHRVSEEDTASLAKAPISAQHFLSALSSANATLISIIEKGALRISATAIEIYPTTKTYQKILRSDNNLALLKSLAAGLAINIHEPGEEPTTPSEGVAEAATETPSPSSAISAIMGNVQEVIEDNADPFAG